MFFPIIILFILTLILKALFHFFNHLHYDNFNKIIIPKEIEHLTNENENYIIVKIICLLYCIGIYFKDELVEGIKSYKF